MIKSRMQTDGFTPSSGQKYTSTLDCVRKVWRTEGIGAFTRGLGPTLIRLVLQSAITVPILIRPPVRHLLMAPHSLVSRWLVAC